jgi:membrane associated rhomboid family serine protease
MSADRDPEAVMASDRCYRHPMRETLIHCTRCDRPICPECMRPASVGFHCPDDVKLGQQTQRAPRTIVGAAIESGRPYVTWTLIGLNVLVYLITAKTSDRGLNKPSTSWLFRKWVLSPFDVAHEHDYYRLLTSAFLHWDPLHIAVNMFALAIIGAPLEQLLGAWRFAAVYLVSAFGGGVFVYAFSNHFAQVAGASGAIYGLFATCLLFVRELHLDPRWLVGTIALNFVLSRAVPNLSFAGHLGGFVIGGVAAVAIGGLPWRRRRFSVAIQSSGLGGILVVLAAGIVWRTAVLS